MLLRCIRDSTVLCLAQKRCTVCSEMCDRSKMANTCRMRFGMTVIMQRPRLLLVFRCISREALVVEWAMTRRFWDIRVFMVSSERSIRRVPCKGVWVTIRAAAYFSVYVDHRSHLTLPHSLGVSLLPVCTPLPLFPLSLSHYTCFSTTHVQNTLSLMYSLSLYL